jgi:hypothetical protein
MFFEYDRTNVTPITQPITFGLPIIQTHQNPLKPSKKKSFNLIRGFSRKNIGRIVMGLLRMIF